MVSLFCGPWVGEFGWEVFCWQGYLRRIAKNHQVIVCSRPGHEALYKDFMAGYVSHDVPWRFQPDQRQTIPRYTPQIDYPVRSKVLRPREIPLVVRDETPCVDHQELIRYNDPKLERRSIVIHARALRFNQERNWPIACWENLLGRIAEPVRFVGHPQQADCIDPSMDARSTDLSQLIKELSMAKVVVGPSSGPMALAMLCDAPVVTWSGNRKDEPRFKKHWNPFSVSTTVFDGWRPEVEEVLAAAEGEIVNA